MADFDIETAVDAALTCQICGVTVHDPHRHQGQHEPSFPGEVRDG